MENRDMSGVGKVWLVGAGPGSGDLLTIKAKRLLDTGDCIVYDRLVGDEVLSMIPPGKQLVDVGKSSRGHGAMQEEINRILIREARLGKHVVRLKGGDPFLFGRGGEELEALIREEIPFEVVPGISSSLAVPAYGGIPVTHRDFVSGIHVVTGHNRDGGNRNIPYKALVEAGGTLVFLMGVGALEQIMEGLWVGGMDRDTPAAILHRGTTAAQRTVTATVGTLAQRAKDWGIKAPSVIVVGHVCALNRQLRWFEKLPLFGEKILVTRPHERGCRLQEELRALGAEVLSVPVIRTVPVRDRARIEEIRTVLGQLDRYQVAAFTSVYGVERFFQVLLESGRDVRALSHMRFAAIGQGTGDALKERGIGTDYMPAQYDGRSLGRLLAGALTKGERILLPRSSMGSPEVLDEIGRNSRLSCRDLAVYDTEYMTEQAPLLRSFMEDGSVTGAVFTSSSTVEGFCRMTGNLSRETVRAFCIGKKTEEAAGKAGMRTVTAANATVEALVECLLKDRLSQPAPRLLTNGENTIK